MPEIGAYEAKTHLPKLLERIQHSLESVRANEPAKAGVFDPVVAACARLR